MTTPSLKVRVVRKPTLKLKVLPRFPSSVTVESPILLDRTGGNYVFSLDMNALLAVLDQLFQPFTATVEQHITAAGPVAINNATSIVRVDQTVGAAMTLNMGLASAKTCPVLISDWKGDAGTNNITINLSGSDKFPGNLTSWTIAADTGSVFLRPVSGGYTL